MAATKQEVIRLLGDSKKVADDLKTFRRATQILSARQPRLIDQYRKQWIAVYHGKVEAQGRTLKSVMAQVDQKELPRENLIIRFIDKNYRTMIL